MYESIIVDTVVLVLMVSSLRVAKVERKRRHSLHYALHHEQQEEQQQEQQEHRAALAAAKRGGGGATAGRAWRASLGLARGAAWRWFRAAWLHTDLLVGLALSAMALRSLSVRAARSPTRVLCARGRCTRRRTRRRTRRKPGNRGKTPFAARSAPASGSLGANGLPLCLGAESVPEEHEEWPLSRRSGKRGPQAGDQS